MMPNVIHHDTLPQLGIECLHETSILWATELFARKGAVKPTWVVAHGQELVWVETDWDCPEDKYRITFEYMPIMFRMLNVTAYSLIVEAWMSAYPNVGADVDPATLPKPHTMPRDKRDEILMVISEDIYDRQILSRFLITQRRRGLAFLGPRMDEDMRMEGDMTGVFKRMPKGKLSW